MSDGPGMIPAVAPVSILDVFTKVIEMQTQLAVINEKMSDLPDHEFRIRVLETAKAKVYGACAILSAGCGAGAAWAAVLITHR